MNGVPVPARTGQTLAAVLMAAGIYDFRHSPDGHPRGLFCGMGVCFECLVTVDGQPGQLACLIAVASGMQVRLAPEIFDDSN